MYVYESGCARVLCGLCVLLLWIMVCVMSPGVHVFCVVSAWYCCGSRCVFVRLRDGSLPMVWRPVVISKEGFGPVLASGLAVLC